MPVFGWVPIRELPVGWVLDGLSLSPRVEWVVYG